MMHNLTIAAPSDLESDLAEMCGVFSLVAGSMRAFGVKLAEKCDRHPGFINALRARLGGAVKITLLRQLERVGRGELDERLAATPCSDGKMQLVVKLPIADQRRVLDEGVCVPVSEDDHVVKRIGEMTYRECQAMFSVKGVRRPEQSWASLQAVAAEEEERHSRYRNMEEENKKRARAIAKRCNMRLMAGGLRLENGEVLTSKDLQDLDWIF
jgi:hypothetical protein